MGTDMPLYDYQCDCGAECESFEECGTETITCPRCCGTMRQVWKKIMVNVGHGSLGYGGKMPDVDPGRVYTMLKEAEGGNN